jgi:hypothetical protein
MTGGIGTVIWVTKAVSGQRRAEQPAPAGGEVTGAVQSQMNEAAD